MNKKNIFIFIAIAFIFVIVIGAINIFTKRYARRHLQSGHIERKEPILKKEAAPPHEQDLAPAQEEQEAPLDKTVPLVN